MFGFSFGEFMVICVVALVAVGPKKLPLVLRTLGQWIRKARTMLYDMRTQSGIDDILRAEGLHGGVNELRSIMRDHHSAIYAPLTNEPQPSAVSDEPTSSASQYPKVEPAFSGVDIDATKEYPPEGPDAYGALPDDLLDFPYLSAPATLVVKEYSAASTETASAPPPPAASSEPEKPEPPAPVA